MGKPKLLSDAEMAALNEQVFEEPVSAERLYAMVQARPRGRACEWVMDRRTLNRICRLNPALGYQPGESWPEQLFGFPIVVEPLAKLELRERRVDASGPAETTTLATVLESTVVRPGDSLVLRVDAYTHEQVDEIAEYARARLPDVKVLVLAGEIQIYVLRTGGEDG